MYSKNSISKSIAINCKMKHLDLTTLKNLYNTFVDSYIFLIVVRLGLFSGVARVSGARGQT